MLESMRVCLWFGAERAKIACDEFTRNNSEVLGSSIHLSGEKSGIIQEHTK